MQLFNSLTGRLVLSSCSLLLLVAVYLATTGDQPSAQTIDTHATPEELHMDSGVSLPLEVKIQLLNNPQKAGDIAELELQITPLLDDAQIEATYVLPQQVSKQSGQERWSGSVAKDEVKRLRLDVVIPDESEHSVSARVTLTRGDYIVTRGAAWHCDLGEPEHATSYEQEVTGLKNAKKLNIIVPKKNAQ